MATVIIKPLLYSYFRRVHHPESRGNNRHSQVFTEDLPYLLHLDIHFLAEAASETELWRVVVRILNLDLECRVAAQFRLSMVFSLRGHGGNGSRGEKRICSEYLVPKLNGNVAIILGWKRCNQS